MMAQVEGGWRVQQLILGLLVLLLGPFCSSSNPHTPTKLRSELCCATSSHDTAIDCLEEQARQALLRPSQPSNKKLLYVTYYTPTIRDHALYAFAVNAHHASQHDAQMHLLSPQTRHDYDRNDQRWNKVKILHDYIKDILLQRSCRQQPASFCTHYEQQPVVEYDYLLWLDADLIVNNQSFSFTEDILEQHPAADIVLSREVNPLNGIANTGSMLVKVSPWTMRFLDIWWDADAYWREMGDGSSRTEGSSRLDGMDQHVLDFLYKQYDQQFRSPVVDHPAMKLQDHVVLLAMDAMNSEFPGLKTFAEDQPVLHIAGESNFIRKHILQHAWLQLCQYQEGDNEEEDVLVRKSFLDDIDYVALHGEEWSAINSDLSQLLKEDAATTPPVEQWVAMLPKIRCRIREAQQSINKFVCASTENAAESEAKQCLDVHAHFYHVSNNALRSVYALANQIYAYFKAHKNNVDPRNLLASLQDVIDAGLEYSLVEQDGETYLSLLLELQGVYVADLQALVERSPQHVSPNMMKVVFYYRFKVSEFIALYYDRLFLLDQTLPENSSPAQTKVRMTARHQQLAIESYEEAKVIWTNMTTQYHYYGTGNNVMNSFQEILLIVKKILHLQCVSTSPGRHRDVSLATLKKLRDQVVKFSMLDALQMLHMSTEKIWKLTKTKPFMYYLSQLTSSSASDGNNGDGLRLPKETIGSMIESVLLVMQCYVQIHPEEQAASSKALVEVVEDLKWLMCILLHEDANEELFAQCMERGVPLLHVKDLYPHVNLFTRHLVDLSTMSPGSLNTEQTAALEHKKLLLIKGLIIKAMTIKGTSAAGPDQSPASLSQQQSTGGIKKMKKVKRKS